MGMEDILEKEGCRNLAKEREDTYSSQSET